MNGDLYGQSQIVEPAMRPCASPSLYGFCIQYPQCACSKSIKTKATSNYDAGLYPRGIGTLEFIRVALLDNPNSKRGVGYWSLTLED